MDSSQKKFLACDPLTLETNWKEIKAEYVKKKAKLIFYVDRHIKLFENGYFAYFTSGRKELKACLSPKQILACSVENKDKLRIITLKKTYLFKLQDPKSALEWA